LKTNSVQTQQEDRPGQFPGLTQGPARAKTDKPAWAIQLGQVPSPSPFLLCAWNFVAPNIFQYAPDIKNLMVQPNLYAGTF
jgi:hypothetical protein